MVESEELGAGSSEVPVDDGAALVSVESLDGLEDALLPSMFSRRSSCGFCFTTGSTFGILYCPAPHPGSERTLPSKSPLSNHLVFIAAQARPTPGEGQEPGFGIAEQPAI